MAFSLEWMLNLKRDEINKIELELSYVNSKLSACQQEEKEIVKYIDTLHENISKMSVFWQISSSVRAIELSEGKLINKKQEVAFLKKEKEMIVSRYNQKYAEKKSLEKLKEKYKESEKYRKEKRIQDEINEISLLMRKED